jgi:hypothetical protein
VLGQVNCAGFDLVWHVWWHRVSLPSRQSIVTSVVDFLKRQLTLHSQCAHAHMCVGTGTCPMMCYAIVLVGEVLIELMIVLGFTTMYWVQARVALQGGRGGCHVT